MNSAYVIKDVDTEEYKCHSDGPQGNSFSFNLAYARTYADKSIAELDLIKDITRFVRWDKGYRVPRNLKVVEIKIKEVK